ncbi:MAG: lipoyl(octanoyl) transferase LipB [Tepidisphaeraceae bacterium]
MRIIDLGTLDYRSAWQRQEEEHERVLAGEEEALLLVEHTPTITFGRRAADSASHLVAGQEQLAKLGVEVVESDRGGDITFHGPGQLVAYPIVRLADHRLSVGGYVKALENSVIASLADFGLNGRLDSSAIGVWVEPSDTACHASANGCLMGKVCALGVRIKRGISLHGIALNVTTDLSYFNLIVPCGLAGRPVTSLKELLADKCPPMADVKASLSKRIIERFSHTVSPIEPK